MSYPNMTVGACKSFPLHPEDCDAINTVRRVFGAISFVGCVFVIFVIWVFNRCADFSQRLIFYLTIAALLNSLGRLFQDSINKANGWCVFQAFWLTYFNYAVMLWVVGITFNMFMQLIKNTCTAEYEIWYHIMCWGVSMVISSLPLFASRYGPSGSWCWIVQDAGWQMGIWYIPLVIIVVYLCVVCGRIFCEVKSQASNWTGTYNPTTRREQELMMRQVQPLRFYPAVFLLLSLFPLINRLINIVSGASYHYFSLVLMHAMSASIQGAAYALVFTLDGDTIGSLHPANIKAAIMRKLAPQAVVQEYPAVAAFHQQPPDNAQVGQPAGAQQV